MSPADSPFAQLPAPGPHPATAELRAYAAGTLAPAEEHRIEAHTLDCERCAELVEGFSMSDATTTDHAVAELRTRLQARLGQAEPEPAAGGWAWPRIAAAAALLALVGTGIWGWEHYKSSAPPATARVETATPAASSVAVAPAAPETTSTADTPAVAAAPKAVGPPAKADYAAVAPAASRHVTSRRRFVPPPAAPAEPVERADDAKAAGMVAMSERAVSADQLRESEYARADAAPAPKHESAATARPATDSVPALSEVAVAAPMRKAKARQLNAAPAMVVNTPMPAAAAINPAPVGGTPAFRDYLRREASQFEPENDTRLSGLVRVQFTVGADGQVSNLKVTRGLRADYDAEALRLVCEGPKWQPGIAGGKRAPLPMEITVPF